MGTALSLLLLPLRAPMLLLLLLISTYLGLHWSRPGSWADAGAGGVTELIWSAECLHALLVVVVCTMPDLLLRRVASMMAASRVISLVLTLLLVTIGGLYLLHLDVLSNVLILASSVLLARLDLVRLRVVPPPFVMTLVLSVLVLGGISLGRSLEVRLHRNADLPQEIRAPAPRATVEPGAAEPRQRQGSEPSQATTTAEPPKRRDGSMQSPTAPGQATTAPRIPGPAAAQTQPGREPDRAIPHLQNSASPGDRP